MVVDCASGADCASKSTNIEKWGIGGTGNTDTRSVMEDGMVWRAWDIILCQVGESANSICISNRVSSIINLIASMSDIVVGSSSGACSTSKGTSVEDRSGWVAGNTVSSIEIWSGSRAGNISRLGNRLWPGIVGPGSQVSSIGLGIHTDLVGRVIVCTSWAAGTLEGSQVEQIVGGYTVNAAGSVEIWGLWRAWHCSLRLGQCA